LKKTFFSNGKLLLTGEYIVLDGATALALPTRYGQYLDVANTSKGTILWKSFDADGSVWLEEEIQLTAVYDNKQDNDSTEINTLIKILHEAWLANPEPLNDAEGFSVTTKLTFPRLWGLGTSSTLINNIAQWFEIDAFDLLAKSFGGSGYDIACAQNDTPILYRLDNGKPIVEPVAAFNPPFTDKLYFVYLNRKQSSKQAIEGYRRRRNSVPPVRAKVDQLTQQILHSKSLAEFAHLLQEHENIMSEILGLPALKILAFPDYPGTIKSLGAWGGDFILATANENPEAYFKAKGFETIIPYKEMILDRGIDFSEGDF
jgi:mevalonate kinase